MQKQIISQLSKVMPSEIVNSIINPTTIYNLYCNHEYNNVSIDNGRISFCKKHDDYHWFIMVESGSYESGIFKADNKKRAAFSYVPKPSYEHITTKYINVTDYTFLPDNNDDKTSLWGYFPNKFTQSHVVDSWKLTPKYTVVKSKPVTDWKFERFPVFKTYNLLSIVPFCGICDCVAYSNYHYDNASSTRNRPYKRKVLKDQLFQGELSSDDEDIPENQVAMGLSNEQNFESLPMYKPERESFSQTVRSLSSPLSEMSQQADFAEQS